MDVSARSNDLRFKKDFGFLLADPMISTNAIAFGWMHTSQKRRPEIAREPRKLSKRTAAAIAEAGLLVLFGCASPGPPLPPSLKLPEAVTDLTTSRVGDHVILHWTTPSHTT